jgi:hypothetical protein
MNANYLNLMKFNALKFNLMESFFRIEVNG